MWRQGATPGFVVCFAGPWLGFQPSTICDDLHHELSMFIPELEIPEVSFPVNGSPVNHGYQLSYLANPLSIHDLPSGKLT
jgi:hypothetical protein